MWDWCRIRSEIAQRLFHKDHAIIKGSIHGIDLEIASWTSTYILSEDQTKNNSRTPCHVFVGVNLVCASFHGHRAYSERHSMRGPTSSPSALRIKPTAGPCHGSSCHSGSVTSAQTVCTMLKENDPLLQTSTWNHFPNQTLSFHSLSSTISPVLQPPKKNYHGIYAYRTISLHPSDLFAFSSSPSSSPSSSSSRLLRHHEVPRAQQLCHPHRL